MKSTKLNITQCHSPCPNCKIDTDFQMFESGAGGDFETYVGDTTESIYRMDMHKVHYMNLTIEELLKPAIKAEVETKKLRNIPDQVMCKVCKTIFKASPISVCR